MTPEPIADRPHVPADYGLTAGGTSLPWSWAEERLAGARNYWVATATLAGRPHVAPVWGLWHDGAFCFSTDAGSRKGRNLTANPRMSVHLENSDEVMMLEGLATPVTDEERLQVLDTAYRRKYEVSMLEVPNADILISEVRPVVAFGWLESDFTHATRWRFR